MITVDKQGGIGRLTLNRPPANVMNYEMLVEMNAALDDLAKDDSVKVGAFKLMRRHTSSA